MAGPGADGTDGEGFSLRRAVAADKPFLLWLRKATMSEYLASIGEILSDAEHLDRIDSHFENARIVLVAGQPVGLLKAYPEEREWVILQIQIALDHQGQGLGSKVVQHVLERAARDGLPVSLSVIMQNPAKRLYERLGFKIVGEQEGEFLMTWTPGTTPPAPSS